MPLARGFRGGKGGKLLPVGGSLEGAAGAGAGPGGLVREMPTAGDREGGRGGRGMSTRPALVSTGTGGSGMSGLAGAGFPGDKTTQTTSHIHVHVCVYTSQLYNIMHVYMYVLKQRRQHPVYITAAHIIKQHRHTMWC